MRPIGTVHNERTEPIDDGWDLIDSRIELLIMAINLHLGGTPMPRPAVYRWKGPSGRELLVMNGAQVAVR